MTGLLWAMARMSPVPGCTSTIVLITGSIGATWSKTMWHRSTQCSARWSSCSRALDSSSPWPRADPSWATTRRGLGRSRLRRRDEPQLEHAVDDDVAAIDRCQRMIHGIGSDGVLRQTGQHGRLGEVEVLGRDTEVVPGRSLDAVRAVAVVGDVEVAVED